MEKGEEQLAKPRTGEMAREVDLGDGRELQTACRYAGCEVYRRQRRRRVAAELSNLRQGNGSLADYIADAKDLHLRISADQEQILTDNVVNSGLGLCIESMMGWRQFRMRRVWLGGWRSKW
ncbi:hypothetical protein V502_05858 [Pseudogymnoascus sp. VKM F-4520 (FW-2644)]|nr:hypothetical protein V502_05858 [Pseudogymnoascus sp. VKM F-4520 (FW-2644)]